MDNSRKRMFAAFAVMAFTLCLFAGFTFTGDSDVDAVDVSGSNVTISVGQSVDQQVAYGFGGANSSVIVSNSSLTSNLPDDLGLEFVLEYNPQVGIAYRMELHLVGTPKYAVNSGTDWDGSYTVNVDKQNNGTVDYTVTGTITVNAVNTSGSSISTGTSSAPISYIDQGYGHVKNATDYYIFQYSKVYITTDYKATISSSNYGIEYCYTEVFGGDDGGKVFGYLIRTGTVTITFDTGTDGGTQRITLHVVADKTGTQSSPIDDLSRGVATFTGMTNPNSTTGSIGSGKTYYVEVGTYIGIWHHQLSPDSRVDVVDISPSMPGVNLSSGDASGTATAPGTYEFTLERGSYSTTTTIVVIDPSAITATSVSIIPGAGGSSITLEASCSPSNADVEWTWEIVSGDAYGHITGSGDSITVHPDSCGRMQIRLTDENSGKTATDYIYVFELAYNANGGSGAPSTMLAIDDSTSYSFTIPGTEPYRSGWEFMGWATSAYGSPSYDAGDAYSCSYSSIRTMYAIWGDYGCLSFDKNGGSGSVPSTQSVLIAEDDYDYITIPSSPVPTMNGMEFRGWCADSSGTGTMYSPGDSVEVDCGQTVTLYAYFEDPYVTYTLQYDANGGSGAPVAQTAESTSGSYTFTVSSQEPTRSGYVFMGWSTSGTSSGTVYHGGDRITVTGTTTLKAVWEAAVIEITSSQQDVNIIVGQSFSCTVTTDVSGCTVSVSGASWLTVSGNNVFGNPVQPGEYTVTITASKAGYTSATQTFTITVSSALGFTSQPSTGVIAYAV